MLHSQTSCQTPNDLAPNQKRPHPAIADAIEGSWLLDGELGDQIQVLFFLWIQTWIMRIVLLLFPFAVALPVMTLLFRQRVIGAQYGRVDWIDHSGRALRGASPRCTPNRCMAPNRRSPKNRIKLTDVAPWPLTPWQNLPSSVHSEPTYYYYRRSLLPLY